VPHKEVDGVFVDTTTALHKLCEQLSENEWIALDTEFIRERTYYPRLCLLQVAGPNCAACVDTLALDDLSPIVELLRQPKITKVFHAARQDIEILHVTQGMVPAPVFDTQAAAALLFGVDQLGYAALVERMTGQRLPKGQTRTDWSRRPLSVDQVAYALDDVRYLGPLYHGITQQLAARQRLHWLDDAFSELTRPETYTVQPEQAWRRIKDVNRLRGVELALAHELAAWRERQAMGEDLPRKWVLSDEALLEIARRRPCSREALSQLRELDDRAVSKRGVALVQIVERVCAAPPEHWPQPELRRTLTPEEDALVDVLAAVIKLCAAEVGVSAPQLATRSDLEAIVRNGQRDPRLASWRDAVAGEALRGVLRGELEVVVDAGRPSLQLVKS
jgi:ribonuclease D